MCSFIWGNLCLFWFNLRVPVYECILHLTLSQGAKVTGPDKLIVTCFSPSFMLLNDKAFSLSSVLHKHCWRDTHHISPMPLLSKLSTMCGDRVCLLCSPASLVNIDSLCMWQARHPVTREETFSSNRAAPTLRAPFPTAAQYLMHCSTMMMAERSLISLNHCHHVEVRFRTTMTLFQSEWKKFEHFHRISIYNKSLKCHSSSSDLWVPEIINNSWKLKIYGKVMWFAHEIPRSGNHVAHSEKEKNLATRVKA